MSGHVRISDGTTWPNPHAADADYDLSWTLTYGNPTREELLLAASTVRAYRYLITETTKTRRDLIIRDLRTPAPFTRYSGTAGSKVDAALGGGA